MNAQKRELLALSILMLKEKDVSIEMHYGRKYIRCESQLAEVACDSLSDYIVELFEENLELRRKETILKGKLWGGAQHE